MKLEFHPYETVGASEKAKDYPFLCFNMAHPAVYLCTVFNKSD